MADYERAVELSSDGSSRVVAFFNRGRAHNGLGNPVEALADLDRAIELAPAFALAYGERGLCYASQGDHRNAIAEYDKAVALLSPGIDQAVAYHNRGVARDQLGDPVSALADFDKAIEIAPELAPAHQEKERVEALLSRGEDDRGTRPEPSTDDVAIVEQLLERGWAASETNDLVTALVAFGQALERDPDNPNAYYARGLTNNKLHRIEEAIADLNRGLDLEPRSPGYLTERGLALHYSGQPESALVDYEAALELDPSYAPGHYNKGFTLTELGRLREALPCFDVAVKLDPRMVDFRAARGEIFKILGDLARAREDLSLCLKLNPDHPKSAGIRDLLKAIEEQGDELEEPEIEIERLTLKMITMSLDSTVSEAVRQVREEGAFYAAAYPSQEETLVTSVYDRFGLRERLTSIADAIGAEILGLKLRQLFDLWAPVTAEADAWALERSETRVVDGPRFVGVVRREDDRVYSVGPTILFDTDPIFGRSSQARECEACHGRFSYFLPVMEEGIRADRVRGNDPRAASPPSSSLVEQHLADFLDHRRHVSEHVPGAGDDPGRAVGYFVLQVLRHVDRDQGVFCAVP